MAKSLRSSTKKANKRRKATTLFGPAELARDHRLSAKLLELASQPKPESEPADVVMSEATSNETETQDANGETRAAEEDSTAMVIDSENATKTRSGKKHNDKRKRISTSSIVFRKHGDKKISKKGRHRGRR